MFWVNLKVSKRNNLIYHARTFGRNVSAHSNCKQKLGLLTSYVEPTCQNCNLHLRRNVLKKRKSSPKNTICSVFFGLSAKWFWPIGEFFSVALSEIHADCPDERSVEKIFLNKIFHHFWTIRGKILAGFSKLISIGPEKILSRFAVKIMLLRLFVLWA